MDVWREISGENGGASRRLPTSPSDEAIMQNARDLPIEVVFTDGQGQNAFGNSTRGYRYCDSKGNPIPREEAEPFRLAGTNIVIRNGLLGVEVPEEEQPDGNA